MCGGLLTAVVLLMVFAAVLRGRWDSVVAIPVLCCLARWGLPWLLRRAWRGIRTWWHGLVLVLVLGVALSGCETMERGVAKLHGIQVDPLPGPCAPESYQAGQCVKVKQEGARP